MQTPAYVSASVPSASAQRWGMPRSLLLPLVALLLTGCGPSAPGQTGGGSESSETIEPELTTMGTVPTTGDASTSTSTTGDESAASTEGEPGTSGDTGTSTTGTSGGTSSDTSTSATNTSGGTSTTAGTGSETEDGEDPLCAGLVTFVPPEDMRGGKYFILRTPADKLLLAGVECLVGDLALVPGLVDASGLESLRVITGDVLASDDNAAAPATETLFVGLDALELIGGHFGVWGSEITSLHGLESLRTIGGSLAAGADLDDLEGLGGLETIGESLQIGQCAGEAFPVLLPSLSGLESLKSVESIIVNAPKLTGPQVLPALTQLSLLEVCNSAAASLSLPALVEVGEINITGSKPWSGLVAPSLTTLAGDLVLLGTGISEVAGLAGLTSIGGDLIIGANQKLPTCVAKAFAEALMVAGMVSIGGNLPDACGM